jgi:hypothetical protein
LLCFLASFVGNGDDRPGTSERAERRPDAVPVQSVEAWTTDALRRRWRRERLPSSSLVPWLVHKSGECRGSCRGLAVALSRLTKVVADVVVVLVVFVVQEERTRSSASLCFSRPAAPTPVRWWGVLSMNGVCIVYD